MPKSLKEKLEDIEFTVIYSRLFPSETATEIAYDFNLDTEETLELVQGLQRKKSEKDNDPR